MTLKFLEPFYRSLFDFAWIDKNKNNTRLAIKYFLVISIISTTVMAINVVYQGNNLVREKLTELEKTAPNLNIDLVDGKLNISGLEQPFVYKVNDFSDYFQGFTLVIDTESENPNLKNYEKQNNRNVIFLAKDKSFLFEQTGEKAEKNYSQTDLHLTKNQIVDFFNNWDFWGQILAFLYFLALCIGIFGTFIYLIFFSLILLIICSLRKKKETYKELLTIGVFSLTLPCLFELLFCFINFSIPLIYPIAFLFVSLSTIFLNKKPKTI